MFRRFQREEFHYKVSLDAASNNQGLGFRLIKNINQLGELVIYNIRKPISKEQAAEAQLQNKKCLEKLNLEWPLWLKPGDNDIEVLRFLQPPACLKSLLLHAYPGASFPGWFKPQNSSSPEHIIHPALKKMTIKNSKNLLSVPAERFGELRCLEELEVQECSNIYSQSLIAPSLKRLVLGTKDGSGYHTCGNLIDNIVDCCSLTYFFLSCNNLLSIQLQKWNLPALEELHISGCLSLKYIIGQSGQAIRGTRGIRTFPSLTSLTIEKCNTLSNTGDLLAEEHLPAIERICVKHCPKLVSLPSERFGKFSSLKELEISGCYILRWRRGVVLPSSLQILSLCQCGDISAWVPSCLQNLGSLVTLMILQCRHIKFIPGNLWSTNLRSLENLAIQQCLDIVSIGGENAISEIKNVSIRGCPNLEKLKQPMLRGSYLV